MELGGTFVKPRLTIPWAIQAGWALSWGFLQASHTPKAPLLCCCAVLPEQMCGAGGAVTALCAQSVAGRHRVLIAHEDMGAFVWDLR